MRATFPIANYVYSWSGRIWFHIERRVEMSNNLPYFRALGIGDY